MQISSPYRLQSRASSSWACRAERSNIYTIERTAGVTLMSIQPSGSVIKPHRASLNTVDFLLESSLSSPSPSLIIFSPCPPHITWHVSFTWRITALQYCVDSCHPTAWISRVYPPLETLPNSPPLEVSKGQWAEPPVPVSQRATGSLLTHRSVHMSAHPPDPSHRLLPLPRPKSSLRLCLSSCPEALFKQLACESNLDVHRQKNG